MTLFGKVLVTPFKNSMHACLSYVLQTLMTVFSCRFDNALNLKSSRPNSSISSCMPFLIRDADAFMFRLIHYHSIHSITACDKKSSTAISSPALQQSPHQLCDVCMIKLQKYRTAASKSIQNRCAWSVWSCSILKDPEMSPTHSRHRQLHLHLTLNLEILIRPKPKIEFQFWVLNGEF